MTRISALVLALILLLQAVAVVAAAGAAVPPVQIPATTLPNRLFATSTNLGIYEIDPVSGAVLNAFAPPEDLGVSDGLAFDGTVLYYLSGSWDSNTLYALDPDDGAVLAAYPLPASSFRNALAAYGGLVYILDYSILTQDITIFDPATGTVVGILDIDGVNPNAPRIGGGMAAIGEPAALMVTTNPPSPPYELLEIDLATGLITAQFEHGLGAGVLGVAVNNGEVYLGRNTGNTLSVFSREGSLLRTVSVPGAVGFQSLGGDDRLLQLTVVKTADPEGVLSPGDLLTYTLQFSATFGVQLGVYDPLTDTLFVGFVPPVPPGVVFEAGAITGTMEISPGASHSLTFVAEVPAGASEEIANRACAYVWPGSLDTCQWSNRVVNDILEAPDAPVLLSPPDGTVTYTQPVTLVWEPAAGPEPDGYNLDLDGAMLTTTTTAWPVVLAPGTHTWAVRAYNATGYSPWSTEWSLEVRRFTVYLPLVMRAWP